jgi:hypothetical protein
MKLDGLRKIIKEEIAKALSKYETNAIIIWKGYRVKVDKDNGEETLTIKPLSNPEAKPKTVYKKDTYPIQEINEDTFHNGEKVSYDDKIYTVKRDNGNVGVEIVGDNEEKLVMRTQLTRVVKEDNFRSDGGLAIGQYEVEYKVKDEYGDIAQDTTLVDVTEDNKDESLNTLLKLHPDNFNRKVISIYNYKPI